LLLSSACVISFRGSKNWCLFWDRKVKSQASYSCVASLRMQHVMCHCQLTRALIVTLDWYSSFSQDERGRLAKQSHLIRPNTYESERIGLTCIRFIKHRFWACSRRYYVPDVAFHRQRTINVSLLDHARLLLPLHVTTHLQVPCRPLTGLNAATSSILLHSSALYPAVRLACSVRSPIHCSEYLSLILSSVFPVTVVPA